MEGEEGKVREGEEKRSCTLRGLHERGFAALGRTECVRVGGGWRHARRRNKRAKVRGAVCY